MSDRLFLYLTDHPDTPLWWLTAEQPEVATGTGDWAELSAWLAQRPERRARPCVVLLAASLATRLLVAIPGTQREKALQALPFALEELAIDEPEQLRITLADRPVSPGRWPVLLWDAPAASALEQSLAQANLTPLGVYSVAAVLPPPAAGEWRVFQLPSSRSYCVLTSAHEHFSFTPVAEATPTDSLAALAAATEPPPTAIDWVAPRSPAEWLRDWQHSLSHHTPPSAIAAPGSPKEQRWRRLWRQVAVAALLVVLLHLALTAWHTAQTNRQIQALNQQITADFHAALPQVTRLVNARVQLQQALDAQNSPQAKGFLALLAPFSAAFAAAHAADVSVKITALHFEGGALTIDLTANQFNSLDALQQQLKAQNSLRVQTRDAGITNGIAKMQLQLSPSQQ